MANLQVIGKILQKRFLQETDEQITQDLKAENVPDQEVIEAFDAVNRDLLITVTGRNLSHPFTKITYRMGVRKIEKEVSYFFGMFRNTTEIAVKTIDSVDIVKTLFWGKVTINHSGSELFELDYVSLQAAESVKEVYCFIIDTQRRAMVNASLDA